MEKVNLLFFIAGILLIVIGILLKYNSPILVGGLLSLLGVILALSMMFRDQTNCIVKPLSYDGWSTRCYFWKPDENT